MLSWPSGVCACGSHALYAGLNSSQLPTVQERQFSLQLGTPNNSGGASSSSGEENFPVLTYMLLCLEVGVSNVDSSLKSHPFVFRTPTHRYVKWPCLRTFGMSCTCCCAMKSCLSTSVYSSSCASCHCSSLDHLSSRSSSPSTQRITSSPSMKMGGEFQGMSFCLMIDGAVFADSMLSHMVVSFAVPCCCLILLLL